jgi:Cu+-exporting ATPase
LELDSFAEIPGKGLEARVEGREVWMGSAAWLAERGVSTGQAPASSVHIAINRRYRGCFTVRNSLRPGADKLIAGLSSHYDLALLSGDNARERERFWGLFGPEAKLHFNQSPENKLGFVGQLQQRGRTVMMVGDGLNDAGALRQSNAGVAVVEKIGAFSPASDVIMEARHVPALGRVLAFSRAAVRVVWLSIALSSLYNVAGLAIAASGRLSPVVCAVLMPLSSITVVAFACGAVQWSARRILGPESPVVGAVEGDGKPRHAEVVEPGLQTREAAA